MKWKRRQRAPLDSQARTPHQVLCDTERDFPPLRNAVTLNPVLACQRAGPAQDHATLLVGIHRELRVDARSELAALQPANALPKPARTRSTRGPVQRGSPRHTPIKSGCGPWASRWSPLRVARIPHELAPFAAPAPGCRPSACRLAANVQRDVQDARCHMHAAGDAIPGRPSIQRQLGNSHHAIGGHFHQQLHSGGLFTLFGTRAAACAKASDQQGGSDRNRQAHYPCPSYALTPAFPGWAVK